MLHIDGISVCPKQKIPKDTNIFTYHETSLIRVNKCVYSVYGQGEIRGNSELH